MKKINFKNDILPHLLILFSFILLTFIYFKPAVFENKDIRQHDILEYQGSAKEINDFREKNQEEALWTNSMFGGMPAYLISTIHKGEFIQKAANSIVAFFPHPTGMILINLICFYILLLSCGVRPVYAAIGAIAYGFATHTIVSLGAGHNNRVKAMGYMPLVLAGVILVFKNRLLTGFIVAAIGVALNIGSNHYQITYYLAIVLGILGVVEFIFAMREKSLGDFFKKAGVLIFAALIGLAANFGSFYTTYEYSNYTMRGGGELTPKAGAIATKQGGLEKEYAFNWSYGILESFSLIIPNVQGGASGGELDRNSNFGKELSRVAPPEQVSMYLSNAPVYWGTQPSTGGPTYFGAIICFLFVLGLLILDTKTRIWLIATTVLAIVLSWGKNFPAFNYLFFDYFPGYNKFRNASWTLLMAQLVVPVGAIMALYKILTVQYSKDLFKKLLIAFIATGGLCFLFGLFAGMFDFKGARDEQIFGQVPDLITALKKDREGLLRSDAFRSFFLILLSAGLIWAGWKEKMSKLIAVIIIGLLVVFDVWLVGKRYLNDKNFERRVAEQHFEPSEADNFILTDKSLGYRVINLQTNPWEDARTSYYHKSVGGYSGAKMQRFHDLLDPISAEIGVLSKNLQSGNLNFSELRILNMLNTKYFILGPSQREVLKNDNALGVAWFVSELKKAKNPDEEFNSLKQINPKTEAVVDQSKFNVNKASFTVDSAAAIKMTDYKPNHLIYESLNTNEGLGVFSEIYYPKGWNCYIDGKEAEIIRVNYVLRAIRVPAGKHKIEFKFEPQSYAVGNTVAMGSSVFLLICVIGGIFFSMKDRKSDNLHT